MNNKRIKEVLLSYAKYIGYPNSVSVDSFVKNHTNPFFKVLLKKKLVKTSDYEHYRSAVILQYKLWKMRK